MAKKLTKKKKISKKKSRKTSKKSTRKTSTKKATTKSAEPIKKAKKITKKTTKKTAKKKLKSKKRTSKSSKSNKSSKAKPITKKQKQLLERKRKDHRIKNNIYIGQKVKVEESRYLEGLTEGKVKAILTNKPEHEFGIKVELDSGKVGRVKELLEFKKK